MCLRNVGFLYVGHKFAAGHKFLNLILLFLDPWNLTSRPTGLIWALEKDLHSIACLLVAADYSPNRCWKTVRHFDFLRFGWQESTRFKISDPWRFSSRNPLIQKLNSWIPCGAGSSSLFVQASWKVTTAIPLVFSNYSHSVLPWFYVTALLKQMFRYFEKIHWTDGVLRLTLAQTRINEELQ